MPRQDLELNKSSYPLSYIDYSILLLQHAVRGLSLRLEELAAFRDTRRPLAEPPCLYLSLTLGLIITLNKAILQSILSAGGAGRLQKRSSSAFLLIPLAVLDLN